MTCKKHPNYKVIRKPVTDCPACIHMWMQKNHPPRTEAEHMEITTKLWRGGKARM